MKRLIILMLAFSLYSTASAQSLNYLLSTQTPKVEIKDGKKVTILEVRTETGTGATKFITFLGSPFFLDVFQTITFIIDSSAAPITAPVMLNLTNDELLVKLPDKVMAVKNVNFKLLGHDFIMVNNRYYEQLYSGKVKLLKKYVRDLIPAQISNSVAGVGYGSSNQQYDGEIRNKEIYYLLFHGVKLKEVKMTQKSVINVLTKENKGHFVNGDFVLMNENDGYLKAMEKVSGFNEEELVKILRNAESPELP